MLVLHPNALFTLIHYYKRSNSKLHATAELTTRSKLHCTCAMNTGEHIVTIGSRSVRYLPFPIWTVRHLDKGTRLYIRSHAGLSHSEEQAHFFATVPLHSKGKRWCI